MLNSSLAATSAASAGIFASEDTLEGIPDAAATSLVAAFACLADTRAFTSIACRHTLHLLSENVSMKYGGWRRGRWLPRHHSLRCHNQRYPRRLVERCGRRKPLGTRSHIYTLLGG